MLLTFRNPRLLVQMLVGAATVVCVAAPLPADDARQLAQQILKTTGIHGGVVVHLGCGNGELTAALRAGDGFLVQGLDADAANVKLAREHVQSLGVYGKVTVDRLVGSHLPFVDNFVNLVLADEAQGGRAAAKFELPLGSQWSAPVGRYNLAAKTSSHELAVQGISMQEIMRVLCPEGVAYVKTDGQWKMTVKPRPGEIDEWTHYLHDASNNAVAHDSVVGPARSRGKFHGFAYFGGKIKNIESGERSPVGRSLGQFDRFRWCYRRPRWWISGLLAFHS